MKAATSAERSELDDLRKQIESVDREFVRLLAERQRLALKVAAMKMEAGIPLRNYSVEKQVIERFSAISIEHGLSAEWGIGLARYLIDKSVEAQGLEWDKRRLAGACRILVVGGHGKMGKWFCGFLSNQGHRVAVFDSLGCESSPFDSQPVLDERVKDYDFIILSVPLERSPGVLRQLLDLRPRGVVFDLCSMKRDVLPAIREGIAVGLHVASIHPLFGPDVTTLHGRNIIICPCGDEEADRSVASLFSETAVNLVSLPPEKHDRLMTLTLGLSHALNLVFANALRNSGEPFESLASLGSSTFNRQLETTRRVVAENMDLYFEIQRQCDHGIVFRLLEDAIAILGSAVAEGRRGEFIEMMQDTQEYLAADGRGAD